jgi:hypothetical protein
VVKGNESYAALGLSLVLALDTFDVSETTFPIVTCQRLWNHDIARVVQEPMRNIDLLGFGFLSRLIGDKAKAKDFLDSRQSRRRDIHELAMRFALTTDDGLRESFKEVLAHFPEDLPYEVEEERSNSGATASLKEAAERWAGLGDIQNYRKHQTETESLGANELVDGLSLADAVAFAQARDNGTILAERSDAGEHSAQTTISAVAAVVIRFGSPAGADYDWAWDVMRRVAAMREPKDTFHGSKIPWHPANHLIVSLVHDRRSSSPRKDSVRWLFELTGHPIEGVAQLAFSGLFMDSDEHVRWVAAQLALDLSLYYRFKINENGVRDDTVDRDARKQSRARALERLEQMNDVPLTSMPPAWVKTLGRRRSGRSEDEAGWDDADPLFNAAFAAKIFPLFPIEAWCQSSLYKPMVAVGLKELVAWTAERLMPSWLKDKRKRRSDTRRSFLIEWEAVLGDLLARAAPFFETEFVRKEFLAPFLTEDEEGLAVLAGFADMTVTRQVLDAPTVPANTLDLLNNCVERVVRDRVFNPNGYRAGEVHGYDLPKLIKALLFVAVETEAPGAARFANGDWSQIRMVMPIVTKLVTATGWSTYVMQNYLTLCERAGLAYPLTAFADQANAVLGALSYAKDSWAGTTLPARIAATVQRLADANFPLRADHAQELLRVLDALIDLGDRRSAALEQAEAFRGVQML